jgi:multidrug efflux pump subunit AcrA (membrane-fusion protein)
VKINLDKMDKEILSGMFVNVQFPMANKTNASTATNDRVLIPESAFVHKGQLIGIYTISGDKKAILRWLRIGKTYGNQVEVLSGLNSNEQYIIAAEGKLYNGAKVSIR